MVETLKYFWGLWKNGLSIACNRVTAMEGGNTMPTACVLYEGKRFEEFRIVGMTIDPTVIAAVVRFMREIDPGALVPDDSAKHRKRRLKKPVLVTDG